MGMGMPQKQMEWRGNPSHVEEIMEADKIGRGHTKSRQSGWTGPLGLMVEVGRLCKGEPYLDICALNLNVPY